MVITLLAVPGLTHTTAVFVIHWCESTSSGACQKVLSQLLLLLLTRALFSSILR